MRAPGEAGFFSLLIIFGLPVTSVAQQINWVDGPRRASLDSGSTDSLAPSISEPASLNRRLWEQIIFNTFDCPSPECEPVLEDRTTMVLTPATVQSLGICHPAVDDAAGELLELFANEEWWRKQIRRWSNVEWTGPFRVGMCDGQPSAGWIHVRGEPLGGDVAGTAQTERTADGRLEGAVIRMATDRDFYRTEHTDSVEVVLAHELGHVLGFAHVEGGHGYVMRGEYLWNPEEPTLTQLAYRVGPGVRFPGVVYRELTTTPSDLMVGSPSVGDSSPATGATFTLSATVRNDGNGAAEATTLRFYRSTDATITSADTAEGTDAVAGLAASGSYLGSVDLTAPSTAGTYYYGACVDAVTDESDITNNCSTSVQVEVSEPVPVPTLPFLKWVLDALFPW